MYEEQVYLSAFPVSTIPFSWQLYRHKSPIYSTFIARKTHNQLIILNYYDNLPRFVGLYYQYVSMTILILSIYK